MKINHKVGNDWRILHLILLFFWDHFGVIFYSDGQQMTFEKKVPFAGEEEGVRFFKSTSFAIFMPS